MKYCIEVSSFRNKTKIKLICICDARKISIRFKQKKQHLGQSALLFSFIWKQFKIRDIDIKYQKFHLK